MTERDKEGQRVPHRDVGCQGGTEGAREGGREGAREGQRVP